MRLFITVAIVALFAVALAWIMLIAPAREEAARNRQMKANGAAWLNAVNCGKRVCPTDE